MCAYLKGENIVENKKDQLLELREKLVKLNIVETKKRDEYLIQIANGDIAGPQTGFATIDKPWLKYFKMDKYYDIKNTKTIYQDILERIKII